MNGRPESRFSDTAGSVSHLKSRTNSPPLSIAGRPIRVAIIGGGLSGLATAVQLEQLGLPVEVTLYEKSDRLGGVIHTETVDGFVLDHGADMFATKPPAAMNLMRQLGVEDRLIEPEKSRRGARIVSGGNLIPIPDGFVLMRATLLWPMLTTKLIGWGGKIRFLLERMIPRRRESEVGDESVASFVRRRMGAQVLDKIVAPLAAGIYTSDVTKLSMRSTMKPIFDMEQQHGSLAAATAARKRSGEDSIERLSTGARYGQFRAFPGGMIELIKCLQESLTSTSIMLNQAVVGLRYDASKSNWSVQTNNEKEALFDQVVLATPAHHAAGLLQDHSPLAAETLRTIQSASTAIVVLVLERDQISKDIETFGFVVPLSEGLSILAGSFASHKFAGRAPADQVILRCFVGGSMQPELLDKTDDQLVDMVVAELGRLIGLDGSPRLSRVVRWHDAMPQYHVGHHEKVETVQDEMSGLCGLHYSSNCLGGVGIAPVIAAAGKLAKKIGDTVTA